jgi:hypothetical protein
MMYLLTKKQASFQENTSLQHDKLYFVNLIFYGMNLDWELILSEETTCIEVMFVCGLMYTYNVCDKDKYNYVLQKYQIISKFNSGQKHTCSTE